MSKSGDNKPGFSFAKLVSADNYKKLEQEMQYSLEFTRIWDHIVPNTENSKLAPIVLKGEDFEDDTKLEHKKKYANKIHAWNKNNIKCKSCIGYICLSHIQQEFQAARTDWLAHNFWE